MTGHDQSARARINLFSTHLLAICLRAFLGAVLRWLLGMSLNALFPAIPPGTLTANLTGGYLIGIAPAVFAHHPGSASE